MIHVPQHRRKAASSEVSIVGYEENDGVSENTKLIRKTVLERQGEKSRLW
jgi:hypothetical protein